MTERRRVRVVDDGRDVRESLCELLRGWGYAVDAAADGWDAPQLLTPPPDIIVTDVPLPDEGASHLIRASKARAGADILVIAYSGWNHLEESARAAGADAFVLKPDLNALERTLRAAPTSKREPASRSSG